MKRDRWLQSWALGCLLSLWACPAWPAMGRAAGTWSVISFPQQPGEMLSPTALAVDPAGNLYVADSAGSGFGPRIEKRDPDANWSVIAASGSALGQVGSVSALAVDSAGDLYVADVLNWNAANSRIQRRDAQGTWSVVAAGGAALGQVFNPMALAVDSGGILYVVTGSQIQKRDTQGNWSVIGAGQVDGPTALGLDTAGNLYVAEIGGASGGSRIQKRDVQGNWSVIATAGTALGQGASPTALAADAAGNLYVAELTGTCCGLGVIEKRDARGNWSVIATYGDAPGQVDGLAALAADPGNNLYVADYGHGLQKRATRGDWSVIAGPATGPGHVYDPSGLAVDTMGNLYVADAPPSSGNGRIQKRDAQGNWSILAESDGGAGLSEVEAPAALAADTAGNLYVADRDRIQKRDAQGNWSVIDSGLAYGPHYVPTLAVDIAGDLYVVVIRDLGCPECLIPDRIEQRDSQGQWSVIATYGDALGQVNGPTALAADAAGNLYVLDNLATSGRIQKRDTQGSWSVVATAGDAPGQVDGPSGLAVDAAGNLYVADDGGIGGRVQARDAHGNWWVIASEASALGQFADVLTPLAVGPAGSLYLASSQVWEHSSSGGQ